MGRASLATTEMNQKKSEDSFFSIKDAREILKQNEIKQTKARGDDIETKVERKKILLRKSEQKYGVKTRVRAVSAADILGNFSPKVAGRAAQLEIRRNDIPSKYKKYYDRLTKLRDAIKNGPTGRAASVRDKDPQKSSKGQIEIDDIPTDADLYNGITASDRERLGEIEEAIKRILNGTYGVCEQTGQQIEKDRLEADPCTRYSLKGQQERERLSKSIDHSRGTAFHSDIFDEELDDFKQGDE